VPAPISGPDPSSASASSATIFSRPFPTSAVQLSSHEFLLPHKVVEVMQGGWRTHIPLTAFVSKTLLVPPDRYFSSSKGSRTLSSASILEDREELLMPPQDWCQAWPRLVEAVSTFLPSAHRVDISHLWKTHFKRIWHRDDFSNNFPLLLQYDICVRKAYCNANLNFDPASWHQGVWDQVIKEPLPQTLALAPSRRHVPLPLCNSLPPAGPATASSVVHWAASPGESVVSRKLPSFFLSMASGKQLAASRFASFSMVEAAPSKIATSSTSVQDVVVNTLPRIAPPNELLHIVTLFRWQAWEALLRDAGVLELFADVPKGIHFG
ncbi:hypothetical protein EV363DRAFT_1110805, partial [Boletus edulis]